MSSWNRQYVIARAFAILIGSIAISPVSSAASKLIDGRVLDATTQQPMAGAYVLAAYHQSGAVFLGHSGSWCVKTRGSYTGADGRFSFPEEKDMRVRLTAIFPDYTEQLSLRISTKKTWLGSKQIISPDLFMLHREISGDHRIYPFVCDRPATLEDVKANIQFLKLMRVEAQKYGPSHRPDFLEYTIRGLETGVWIPNSEKR